MCWKEKVEEEFFVRIFSITKEQEIDKIQLSDYFEQPKDAVLDACDPQSLLLQNCIQNLRQDDIDRFKSFLQICDEQSAMIFDLNSEKQARPVYELDDLETYADPENFAATGFKIRLKESEIEMSRYRNIVCKRSKQKINFYRRHSFADLQFLEPIHNKSKEKAKKLDHFLLTADFDGQNLLTDSKQSIEKIENVLECFEAFELEVDEDEDARKRYETNLAMLNYLMKQSKMSFSKSKPGKTVFTETVLSSVMD